MVGIVVPNLVSLICESGKIGAVFGITVPERLQYTHMEMFNERGRIFKSTQIGCGRCICGKERGFAVVNHGQNEKIR